MDYSKKTVPELIKLAVKHFNAYIRQRDMKDGYFICIACGQPKSPDKCHASHYMASTYSATRFDEDNVSAGCSRCNTHLHGNLVMYRQRLITKIGIERVQALEYKARMPQKWDREGLVDIIETYKAKCKQQKNAA